MMIYFFKKIWDVTCNMQQMVIIQNQFGKSAWLSSLVFFLLQKINGEDGDSISAKLVDTFIYFYLISHT